MTTSQLDRQRLLPFQRSRVAAARHRTLAGVLLLAAGAAILMGIITAEALYPATYTTHDNEISDLGATRPPNSVILQPSATIFDTLMLATGVVTLAAAYELHRGFRSRRVTLWVGLVGLGILGVGVFPGNYGTLHPIFALLAFVSGGVAAVVSARVQDAPMRFVSRVLGAVTLCALAFGMVAVGTEPFNDMGKGGVERWIAYPVVLWMVAFGGYLLGDRRAEN